MSNKRSKYVTLSLKKKMKLHTIASIQISNCTTAISPSCDKTTFKSYPRVSAVMEEFLQLLLIRQFDLFNTFSQLHQLTIQANSIA